MTRNKSKKVQTVIKAINNYSYQFRELYLDFGTFLLNSSQLCVILNLSDNVLKQIFEIFFYVNQTHRIRSGRISLWTISSRRGWCHSTWVKIKVVIPVISSVIIVIKWFGSVSPTIIRITIIVIIYNGNFGKILI